MGQRLASLVVARARSLRQRLLGLIGRTTLGDDEGMLFENCSAIHTLFMRMPIDVLFLDEGSRIVRAVPNLRPWRPFIGCAGASRVVELAPGAIERRSLRVGDCVRLKERTA